MAAEDDPVLFKRSAAERIVRSTRFVEGQAAFELTRPVEPTTPASFARIQMVRVTSTSTTDSRYPGKVQSYVGNTSTWSDEGDCWVIDGNGETLDTERYLGRLAGERAADSRPIFTVIRNVTPASGITVQASDGSPSYSTQVLLFDEADGFVLSNPVGGTTQIDLASASATQKGAVDTTTQTFAGEKTFSSAAFFSDDCTVTGDLTGGTVYSGGNFVANGNTGISTTIVIPKATDMGSDGSITVVGGIVTAYTAAT